MANFIRAANVASLGCYPPAREASREVAKFNQKKKSAYPPIRCQRICESVAKFDLN